MTAPTQKPELLAPAGNLQKLKVALAHGADAVYCGLPSFSLRARENDFTFEDLLEGRRLTREAGKRMYLTCNIFPRAPQLPVLEKFIAEKIPELEPDAIIFADTGVFSLLRKHLPEMKLHLSVQANTVNPATARYWYEQGVKRVIVARELSLAEIQAIHAAVPELELEAFVHGSICFTYSGRCLISNWLTYRDGNRGTCANSCRWKWTEVEESERPRERFTLEEDQHGSYLFNSKDLCLIEHLEELHKAGVGTYKLEGRHKSVGYLATIVRAYRHATDDFLVGRPFDPALLAEVYKTGNRGFTKGFYSGTQKDLQNYERKEVENPQTFLGLVEESDATRVLIAPRNQLHLGDQIEVTTPTEIFTHTVTQLENEKGEPLTEIHGGQTVKAWVTVGQAVPEYSILRRSAA
jgi:putative protease